MQKKQISISAISLRYLLCSIVLVLICSIFAIAYYSQGMLAQKAASVNKTKAESEYSLEEVQSLQKLRKDLGEHKTTIKKADQLVAQSQSYTYQNQVINDINDYATRTNVRIEGFDFSADKTDPAIAHGSLSAARKLTVAVNIGNETPYDNFLRFLRAIEENQTKLQLTGITLLPRSDEPYELSQTLLEMEVYIQ